MRPIQRPGFSQWFAFSISLCARSGPHPERRPVVGMSADTGEAGQILFSFKNPAEEAVIHLDICIREEKRNTRKTLPAGKLIKITTSRVLASRPDRGALNVATHGVTWALLSLPFLSRFRGAFGPTTNKTSFVRVRSPLVQCLCATLKGTRMCCTARSICLSSFTLIENTKIKREHFVSARRKRFPTKERELRRRGKRFD